METKTKVEAVLTSRLEKLGFKKAATTIQELKTKKNKLMIAYEFYRVVKEEKMRAFDEKLKLESRNWDGRGGYRTVSFTRIENYESAPPEPVLMALEEAQGRKCFDEFEVAHIRQVQDPILFGKIHGCSDYFFISQWDNDLKIEDILTDKEG